MFHLPYRQRRHLDPLPGEPALDIRNLIVEYPGRSLRSLDGVSLTVPIGARIALVGPNGSGKSTLLKAISGLLPVRGGSIRITGHPPGACHHRVAYLSQRSELDWRFPISVRALAMTGRYVHLGWLKRPGVNDGRIVDELLSRLELSGLGARQISQLSGGQQQRLLLARALAQESDLLLLDEPLNAVDARTRAIITTVLDQLRDKGKTVIAATHDLDRLSAEFDGALFLDEGKVAQSRQGQYSTKGIQLFGSDS